MCHRFKCIRGHISSRTSHNQNEAGPTTKYFCICMLGLAFPRPGFDWCVILCLFCCWFYTTSICLLPCWKRREQFWHMKTYSLPKIIKGHCVLNALTVQLLGKETMWICLTQGNSTICQNFLSFDTLKEVSVDCATTVQGDFRILLCTWVSVMALG